jgi:hypothetical protein
MHDRPLASSIRPTASLSLSSNEICSIRARLKSPFNRLSFEFQSEDRKRPIKLAQVSSPGIIIKLLERSRRALDYNAPSAYTHATHTHTYENANPQQRLLITICIMHALT